MTVRIHWFWERRAVIDRTYRSQQPQNGEEYALTTPSLFFSCYDRNG